MKNVRRILLATAVFTSAMATGAASAQTTPTNGTFNNTALTFTLDNDVTNFMASVLSSYETKSNNANATVATGFNITGFGLSGVTTTTNVAAGFPAAGGTRGAGGNTFYTWNDQWQMAPLSLSAGTYNFTVQGITATSGGGFNGSYSYTAAVSPVPEPATYLMLLAGMAVIGAATLGKVKRGTGSLVPGSKFSNGSLGI